MPRRLKRPWIEEYSRYVEVATESPHVYHFWAAATGIAATLKRNVYIDRVTWKMYPNLYTILVGRPGLGKGAAIGPIVSLLRKAGTTNILSDRVTMEFVLERLSQGFPKFGSSFKSQLKGGMESAALLISSELSVFVTASQFTIRALTDLWDCKEGSYGYGTRGKGEFNIVEPNLSLLGGSAQEWLVRSIPADAVAGGFTRRVNFVFANKKDKKVAWPSKQHFHAHDDLVEDLRQIAQLRGEYTFTPGARRLFESYYDSCEPNEFDDEATAVYKTSKWTNASKLAMVLSASRDDSMLIEECDFREATKRTEQVSEDLGKVFRAVGESPLIEATAKVLDFIELHGYTSRNEILSRNWKHVTAEDLDRIIVTLREGGVIGERYVGKKTEYFLVQKPTKGATP